MQLLCFWKKMDIWCVNEIIGPKQVKLIYHGFCGGKDQGILGLWYAGGGSDHHKAAENYQDSSVIHPLQRIE